MKSIQRRQFIASSLGAAILGSASVRTVSASPGDRIGVAVIGVNGRGHGHLGNLTKRSDIRIVSLCDIDQRVLDRGVETVAKSHHEKPKLVGDFREVLQDPAVDAVVIATPHHWHCPIAIPALRAGKDIYVEKPASHVFQEGRALVESARRHNRVVQHGTQMRSTEVTFLAAEVLESGILGEIKMTKAWDVQRGKGMKPQPDAPVPAGVDYHLGEIAFRLKRVMEFDPDREIFPKDPEGNKLLTKQYRAPWSLA